MIFEHKPIMPLQCIEGLDIKPDGIYVDATLGGGGHSHLIGERLSEKGILIGIDRDKEALKAAGERLSDLKCKVITVHSNYSEIKNVLKELNIDKVDGILADLGVSSYQLDNEKRGFSYRFDSPLDMRMDQEMGITARDVVNGYEFSELFRIIRDYGEERFAKSIASNIVKRREIKPIETTFELVEIINSSMPQKIALKGPHKAKRTFQAIRIEVNQELTLLTGAVKDFFTSLKVGGRLAVITFHSLEDRIVKNVFNDYTKGCICPKDFPVCVCGNTPKGKLINKKPIIADEKELDENLRASSAKLRVIEKVEENEEKDEACLSD
ncbi:MAG: 16S rRNA (cytosine(1402)-N(4))-methyltransferase RsmH [Ruminococcaceae bacterium]|nr:16S rRNA (cytosine(1402)-N(4))-methyltransferase RsmH [Oscillospiraceae bacterium]